ncbi:hypothetical protein MRX96_023683 [Rhipicephalus microplus]
MVTKRTLGDILKDEDPHSVAACRTRSQLRKFFNRGSGQQRDKALALHRQKLEIAAAIRRQKERERQQTTPTAGKNPLQAHSESPESAAPERPDLKTNDECQPCGQRDQSQEKKSKSQPAAEVTSVRPEVVATQGEAPRSSSEIDTAKEPDEGMDLTARSSKWPRGTLENEEGREGDDGGCEGPPSKANLQRRATLKPKPNIPPDKRSTPTSAPRDVGLRSRVVKWLGYLALTQEALVDSRHRKVWLRSHGVTVSTVDSESSNPSSNLEPEKPKTTDKLEQHLPTVKAPSDADTLYDDMEDSDSTGSGLAGKRPRDIGCEDPTTSVDAARGEPPAKTPGMMLLTLKQRPNLQTNPRLEAKQPFQKPPGA